MAVTVIPYNDTSSEIFGAWRTIEDIKNKAKQVAMDQALAEQHIQSSRTIDQLNQAKLQMEQQQANEFTSPQGIQNRQQMQDSALQLRQGDITQQSLQINQQSQMNPLLIKHQLDMNRQAQTAADSAQQNYNAMMEMMPDKKDLDKKLLQAEKYKLISQNALDPHTADLMAQINSVQTKQTFDQLPKVIEFQQKQLDQALSDMGSKGVVDRLKVFSAAASQIGVPGAKAAVKGLPGYDNFQDVPDDSMGNHGSEKDREMHMLVSLAKSGNKDAIEVLGSRIANSAGAAKPSAMAGMLDDKGKPIFNSAPDPLVEASKRVAAKFATQAKLNPQTGEYSIGDEAGANAIQRRENVLQGTQRLAPTTQGTKLSQPPATPTPTQPTIQSGTQKIEGSVNPLDKFTEMDDVINKRYKDVKDKTYEPNRAELMQKRSNIASGNDVDSLVSFPLDPQFSISRTGQIFDSTKANTLLTRSQKTLGGLSRESDAIDNSLSIEDKKFNDTASSAIQGGMNDKQATAGQTAKFSAVMSQLARGYKQNGSGGMKAVLSIANQHYGPGDMTQNQVAQIKALLGVYGIK